MLSVSTRGQQQYYGNSRRNQGEASVNGDGTTRSKSLEDEMALENGTHHDETPSGGYEEQQELQAPPVSSE